LSCPVGVAAADHGVSGTAGDPATAGS